METSKTIFDLRFMIDDFYRNQIHIVARKSAKQIERTRFVAVLEIPPVESVEIAVRVQIVKDFKGK
jgi:hypothetical protein